MFSFFARISKFFDDMMIAREEWLKRPIVVLETPIYDATVTDDENNSLDESIC